MVGINSKPLSRSLYSVSDRVYVDKLSTVFKVLVLVGLIGLLLVQGNSLLDLEVSLKNVEIC